MERRNFIGMAAAALLTLIMAVSCDSGGGGGGGSSLIDGGGIVNGGGGGTGSSTLAGKWTSTSATGTVAYGTADLGKQLASVINRDMTSFVLDNVATLEFNQNGSVTLYDMGALFGQGTYTLQGNTLNIKDSSDGSTVTMNIVLNGGEFTLTANDNAISVIVAWAIGNAVLKNNNYQGMTETGTDVSSAKLVIKFKKLS